MSNAELYLRFVKAPQKWAGKSWSFRMAPCGLDRCLQVFLVKICSISILRFLAVLADDLFLFEVVDNDDDDSSAGLQRKRYLWTRV